ncbi:hypothetical protein [Streptomyces sp. NBC_00696]|uniref:hypothetical protein n=1 Tax=Streptomyces sp. NBC_00696 TaxID=2903672 RepID=UPI002E350AB0|nr:hypothetical protein [Streptomyces sp. NBC_00696]
MDITTLVIILSTLVTLAGAVLTVGNDPPLWTWPAAGLVALVLSGILLDLPLLASALGDNAIAAWCVRLAAISTTSAVLSLLTNRCSETNRSDPAPE